jgi:hypothetical protein
MDHPTGRKGSIRSISIGTKGKGEIIIVLGVITMTTQVKNNVNKRIHLNILVLYAMIVRSPMLRFFKKLIIENTFS